MRNRISTITIRDQCARCARVKIAKTHPGSFSSLRSMNLLINFLIIKHCQISFSLKKRFCSQMFIFVLEKNEENENYRQFVFIGVFSEKSFFSFLCLPFFCIPVVKPNVFCQIVSFLVLKCSLFMETFFILISRAYRRTPDKSAWA